MAIEKRKKGKHTADYVSTVIGLFWLTLVCGAAGFVFYVNIKRAWYFGGYWHWPDWALAAFLVIAALFYVAGRGKGTKMTVRPRMTVRRSWRADGVGGSGG